MATRTSPEPRSRRATPRSAEPLPRASRTALFARRGRRRGVAFVLVLGALTILSVMLTEIQDESSAELASALQVRDALVAEYAAKSGTNLVRLLIASEPTIRKGLTPMLGMLFGGEVPQIPVWEFSEQVLGVFNDAAGTEAFVSFSGLDLGKGKNLGLPGAAFELRVVDEDSKINVNAAARDDTFSQVRLIAQLSALMAGPQYDPLFERRDRDGNYSDRQTICAALIDWVDSKQDMTLCDPTVETAQQMPAEDSYYELLDVPYSRKNAAFDSLEELRRVRGVGDDFWATFVDPDPEEPRKRTITVWGSSGAVNVNTAPPQTLLALVCSLAREGTRLCVDPLEMQKFLTLATLARMFTTGLPPFSSPKAFINLLKGKHPLLGEFMKAAGLEPIELKSEAEAEKQMSTESKVFSIYAVGVVRSGKRESRVRTHTVVDFRNAPAPAEQTPSDASGIGVPVQQTGDTGTGGQGGIARAVAPSPSGNVIYFRME